MKNVWCFGTRWDEHGRRGTSIFKEIFLKYNIAFAYTHDCLKMREGDLISFSDGYDIIAIGKAISPPAFLEKFDISYDPKHCEYFQDSQITGCRVKIITLSEEDCFVYKKIGEFCSVDQEKERINVLWHKYTENNRDGSDPKLNIFHWATKELSQDAFLSWLIQWSSKGNITVNQSLHEIGKEFLNTLISKFIPSFTLPQGSIVKVFKQYKYIDIAVKIETPSGNYAILIEDKVHADIYNNLEKYLSLLKKDETFRDCIDFFPILIKTGDQFSYDKALTANFRIFLRKDFLNFLSRYKDKCSDHPMLSDFYSHITSMEKEVQSFQNKPIGLWTREWNPWKGFYSYLSQHTPFITWNYVANASGGFLCSRMDGDSVKELSELGLLYWQIESNKKSLCLKIGEVYANNSAIRDKAIAIVDEYISENKIQGIDPPARKGCGCYMTLKIVKQENWLGRDDEIVNMEQIVDRLYKFAQMIEKITEKVTDDEVK